MPIQITTSGMNIAGPFPVSIGASVTVIPPANGSTVVKYVPQSSPLGSPVTSWAAGMVTGGPKSDIAQVPMFVQIFGQGGSTHTLQISDPDDTALIPDYHWKSLNTSFASSAALPLPVLLNQGGTGGTSQAAALLAVTPNTSNAKLWAMSVATTGTPDWNYYHGWGEPIAGGFGSTAFQKACSTAISRGCAVVLPVPGTTYTFTTTVGINTAAANPGQALQIRCWGQAIIDYSAVATTGPAIQWQGVSGPGGIQDVIEGLRMVGQGGSAGGIGIQMLSMNGARIRKCRHSASGTAILFHNIGVNNFTEDGLVEDNFFESSVNNWVEYRSTGGGDSSFHATGLLGQNIGQLGDGCNVIFQNTGTQPYNSPLEVLVFFTTGISTGGGTVINQQSAFKSNWKGWLRFEGNRRSIISLCDPNSCVFQGPIVSNGPSWARGAMDFPADVIANANGTFSSDGLRSRVQIRNYQSGTGIISIIGTCRVTITLRREGTGDYDVRHSFIAMADDYGTGGYLSGDATSALKAVTTGAASSYGIPTYVISASNVLFVSSNTAGSTFPASTITCYVDLQQVAQSLNYDQFAGHCRINDLAAYGCTSSDVSAANSTITFQGGVGFNHNARVRFSIQTGTISGLTSGNYYFLKTTDAALSTYAFGNNFFPPVGTSAALVLGTTSANFYGQLFTY